jgi:hypothetical protein
MESSFVSLLPPEKSGPKVLVTNETSSAPSDPMARLEEIVDRWALIGQ